MNAQTSTCPVARPSPRVGRVPAALVAVAGLALGLGSAPSALGQNTTASTCDAAPLLQTTGTFNISATTAGFEQEPSCLPGIITSIGTPGDQWVRYIPATSGAATISLRPSNSASPVGVTVFSGCGGGATALACGSGVVGATASTSLTVIAGTTYLIRFAYRADIPGVGYIATVSGPAAAQPTTLTLDTTSGYVFLTDGTTDISINGIPYNYAVQDGVSMFYLRGDLIVNILQTLRVVGSRPAIIIAGDSVQLSGASTIDASAVSDTPGPGGGTGGLGGDGGAGGLGGFGASGSFGGSGGFRGFASCVATSGGSGSWGGSGFEIDNSTNGLPGVAGSRGLPGSSGFGAPFGVGVGAGGSPAPLGGAGGARGLPAALAPGGSGGAGGFFSGANGAQGAVGNPANPGSSGAPGITGFDGGGGVNNSISPSLIGGSGGGGGGGASGGGGGGGGSAGGPGGGGGGGGASTCDHGGLGGLGGNGGAGGRGGTGIDGGPGSRGGGGGGALEIRALGRASLASGSTIAATGGDAPQPSPLFGSSGYFGLFGDSGVIGGLGTAGSTVAGDPSLVAGRGGAGGNGRWGGSGGDGGAISGFGTAGARGGGGSGGTVKLTGYGLTGSVNASVQGGNLNGTQGSVGGSGRFVFGQSAGGSLSTSTPAGTSAPTMVNALVGPTDPNPYISDSPATPTIEGTAGGAAIAGKPLPERGINTSIYPAFAATPPGTSLAMIATAVTPPGYLPPADGWTWLIVGNVSNQTIDAPRLGVGPAGFTAAPTVRGWTVDPRFGGSGIQTITSLAPGEVYWTLIPTSLLTSGPGFNLAATFGSTQRSARAGALALNVPLVLTPCRADFNSDGDLNADDLGDYITCFFSRPPCPSAEFNADGDVNADDLGDYITAFFQGGC